MRVPKRFSTFPSREHRGVGEVATPDQAAKMISDCQSWVEPFRAGVKELSLLSADQLLMVEYCSLGGTWNPYWDEIAENKAAVGAAAGWILNPLSDAHYKAADACRTLINVGEKNVLDPNYDPLYGAMLKAIVAARRLQASVDRGGPPSPFRS